MTHDLFSGFSQLLTPEAIGLLFVGMAIGMFMGMLPGMGVSLALSLMLPFLYHMSVIPAITLMLATQAASYYAASITAILLNTPGAPESYPTTLDGFPMAQRGEAGRALAISAASTWAGGWIACAVLLALLPVSGSLVNLFHPPEFVAIIILALVLIGGTGESTSSGKVILSGAIGLMFSFIGADPVTGIDRFTFGNVALMSGLNVVPFALGVFAHDPDGRDVRPQRVGRRRPAGDAARRVPPPGRPGPRRRRAVLDPHPALGARRQRARPHPRHRRLQRQLHLLQPRAGRSRGSPASSAPASRPASRPPRDPRSRRKSARWSPPSRSACRPASAWSSSSPRCRSSASSPGPTLLRSEPSLPYSMMWVMAIAGLLSCARRPGHHPVAQPGDERARPRHDAGHRLARGARQLRGRDRLRRRRRARRVRRRRRGAAQARLLPGGDDHRPRARRHVRRQPAPDAEHLRLGVHRQQPAGRRVPRHQHRPARADHLARPPRPGRDHPRARGAAARGRRTRSSSRRPRPSSPSCRSSTWSSPSATRPTRAACPPSSRPSPPPWPCSGWRPAGSACSASAVTRGRRGGRPAAEPRHRADSRTPCRPAPCRRPRWRPSRAGPCDAAAGHDGAGH